MQVQEIMSPFEGRKNEAFEIESLQRESVQVSSLTPTRQVSPRSQGIDSMKQFLVENPDLAQQFRKFQQQQVQQQQFQQQQQQSQSLSPRSQVSTFSEINNIKQVLKENPNLAEQFRKFQQQQN